MELFRNQSRAATDLEGAGASYGPRHHPKAAPSTILRAKSPKRPPGGGRSLPGFGRAGGLRGAFTAFAFALAPVLFAGVAATDAHAQAAEPWEAACIMRHLDPNGDGFLSIRSGPGSNYSEILRVRNGDSMPIDTRKCRGKWCYAESINKDGRRLQQTGWVHTGWCEMIP